MKSSKMVLLLIACALVAITAYFVSKKSADDKKIIYINNNKVMVDVADAPVEQMKGLMYRKKMPENEGMLFVFDQKGKHPFWMKNTYIVLDMLWLNEEKQIVHIENSVPPCMESPCATYAAVTYDAKYVLELNGGWAIKRSLKIGDTVVMEL